MPDLLEEQRRVHLWHAKEEVSLRLIIDRKRGLGVVHGSGTTIVTYAPPPFLRCS